VPNATERTVYSGRRKNRMSHRIPGVANEGQNQRG
jgi:hypothetical protein